MFQSAPGREAFFGATSTHNSNMDDNTEKEKEDEKSQNNTINMEGDNGNDVVDVDDNGEATTKHKRASIRTGMPTMQSTFLKRLKEVLMNLSFSTTDIDIDIGSDVRVVRAVKKYSHF